jgi:hypothetical protein
MLKARVCALGFFVALALLARANAQDARKIDSAELENALKGLVLGEGTLEITLGDGSEGGGAGPTVCNSCLEGDVNCNGSASQALGAGDCQITGLLGPGHLSFIDAHRLVVPSESVVRIDQVSDSAGAGFDSLLILADAGCNVIAANDDCVVCCNSCLEGVLPAGTYFVATASFDNLDVGPYTMTVRCRPLPVVPATTPWGILAGIAVVLAGGAFVLARRLRTA